jgi:hypothetical protein
MSHRCFGALVIAAMTCPIPAVAQQASKEAAAAQSGDVAAVNGFRSAINEYLSVRAKIREEIPPLKVTPRAGEISATSDALARAVQRARPKARQGAFFTPPVAGALRRLLAQALRQTDRASVYALLTEEEAAVAKPTIHGRYPAGGVLASTPAVLLHALPALPSELEYRFMGRTLVLRDVEAALILDYLQGALPPP